MEYSVFLDVLHKIEDSLNDKCELFNKILEASKYDVAIRLKFAETLRKAKAELHTDKLI